MKEVKIVAISDTHNAHKKLIIPQCDILIHSGDATSMGYEHEVRQFAKWLKSLHGTIAKHIIFVPGNHELNFEKKLPASKEWLFEEFPELILLMDEGIELEGIKIWGSPVQPRFFDWAFNKSRGEQILKHWNMIPEDTEVLITHGPPYMILDEVLTITGESYTSIGQGPRHVGCEMLRATVERIKPDVHIFGHIHCARGEFHKDGTSFYNASIMDEMYKPSYEPFVIAFIVED
jgi:Icc-related predicted phosphoesterase